MASLSKSNYGEVDFLIVELMKVIITTVMFEVDVLTNVSRADFKTSGSFINS